MAGLLDGAEEHLVWLVKAGHEQALDPIITLYSQTREWEKGINMFEAHSELFVKEQHFKAIANFYSEAALSENKPQLMNKAISLNYKAVRPLYDLGLSAYTSEDYVKAIYYWRELVCQFTLFAPLFIDQLAHSYKQLNLTHQFHDLLCDLLDKGGVLIKIKHCQALLEQGNTKQAFEFLTDSLKRQPTIRGFSFLLQLMGDKNPNTKSPYYSRIFKQYVNLIRPVIKYYDKKFKKTDEKRLAFALEKHKYLFLKFIKQTDLPFDNNQAERDLRMIKVKQKVSGCFRSQSHAKHFDRIKGYIYSVK